MKTFLLSLAIVIASGATTACSGTSNTDLSGTGASSSGGGGGGAGAGNGSGSGEAARLFSPPSSTEATPDSIYGLWGGSTKTLSVTFDVRMKLGSSTATFAARCMQDDGRQSPIVGVTVAARVDDDAIRVLESKTDERGEGDLKCRTTAQPRTFVRCDANEFIHRDCFELDGTSLTLYGMSTFDNTVLTKISD